MGKQLGVDLGTTNTRICCKDRGPVLRAPTAIAVNKQTREVIAVGSEAKHMLGKTPDGIDAYTPIQGGVIADFDIAVALLRYFFHRIQAVSFLSRPTAAVCIPRGATEVERRALEDAAFEAGAKLVVRERLMTHGVQRAYSKYDVSLEGEDAAADVVSRSVARDDSYQKFDAKITGNAKCHGHTECDSIIMDRGKILAVPALEANDIDATLVHEAAIGKIAGEQIIKLMTLGLTEQEAEEQIVNGFLR